MVLPIACDPVQFFVFRKSIAELRETAGSDGCVGHDAREVCEAEVDDEPGRQRRHKCLLGDGDVGAQHHEVRIV